MSAMPPPSRSTNYYQYQTDANKSAQHERCKNVISKRRLAPAAIALLGLILNFSTVYRWNHFVAIWVAVIIVSVYLFELLGSQSLFWIAGVLMLGLMTSAIVPPALPVETETHGWLMPADDSTPPNGCSNQGINVSNDELLMLMGTMAVYTSRKDRFAVLQLGGCSLLKMQRGSENGIAFDADIFNEDDKLVAHIEKNEFYLSSGKYSYAKRPDRSTLAVYDEYGKEVLWVRYLNPNVVRIRGVFRCKSKSPLLVTDDRVISSGMSEGNSCSAVGPMTITAFSFF